MPKIRLTIRGVTLRRMTVRRNISVAPPTKPISGEATIGSTIFGQSPLLAPWLSVTDQCSTLQSPRAVPRAAPHSPPTSEWLELDGSPSHHVNSPQMMALSRAPKTVAMVTKWVSTRPLPIVVATAVPIRAPRRLNTAAQAMAQRGVSTLVETTVAMALAVS